MWVFLNKNIVILLLWDLLNVSRIIEGSPADGLQTAQDPTQNQKNQLKLFWDFVCGGCFQGLFACFCLCYFVLMRELCRWQHHATKKLNAPLTSRQHQDTLFSPSVVLLGFGKKAYFIWHFPFFKKKKSSLFLKKKILPFFWFCFLVLWNLPL